MIGLLLLLGPGLLLASCGGGESDDLPEGSPRLVFYGRPDCDECKAVEGVLAEVRAAHEGKVGFEWTDSSDEAVRTKMRRSGIDGPKGAILFGQDGFPRWVSKGHDQKADAFAKQIEATLAAKPGEPEDYGK